jgi:aspartate aminotransferase
MNFVAERLNVIEPSPTLAITARARELKAAGRDVIGFGAGEPDFDTPEHIKEAARRAMAAGQTKYTAEGGSPAAKKAVIEKFRRENGLEFKPTEVTLSNGGKQVLYNLFLSTLNPGDEVVIPAPYWVSYADMARMAQAVPKFVYSGIDHGYLITPEQLDAAITPKTRLVIINSPNNPTGAAYTKNQLEALGRVLLKHSHVLICSDDIYEHIVYGDLKFYNLLMLFPELRERTFIVNGVSKAYSMTGWRIGVGAGPDYIIKNMEKLQGQSTSNPCSIAQAAAIAAFSESQDCVEEMRVAFEKRRELVYRMLQAMPGVRAIMPQGAFYMFPDIHEVYANPRFQAILKEKNDASPSRAFCAHLLDHYDVAAVPGSAFGDDNALRISYALDEDSLRRGLERLGTMIHDLKG